LDGDSSGLCGARLRQNLHLRSGID
jgi:hypothetical protein